MKVPLSPTPPKTLALDAIFKNSSIFLYLTFFLDFPYIILTVEKEFFSAPEVSELLKVDRNKIIQLIAIGELRAVDVSLHRSQRPRWRISRKDLEAFLSRRSSTPEPEMKRRHRKKKANNEVIEFIK